MDDIVLNLDMDVGAPPKKFLKKGGRWTDRFSFSLGCIQLILTEVTTQAKSQTRC